MNKILSFPKKVLHFDHIKEVETVFSNCSKVELVGFRVREEVLKGKYQNMYMGWAVCTDLESPDWIYDFKDRASAKAYLMNLKYNT